MEPRIEVIGVEPGAAALPAEARAAALSCSLLVGAARHLALLPEFSGEVLAVEGRLGSAVARLASEPGLRAAVLATGDPGFFGIAQPILRRVGRDEVRIWPAVSAMQLAFARAGETWSEARFASLHGRPLEGMAPVLGAPRLGLFTDPVNTPARIAAYAADAGWGDLEMVVAEDLGLPGERLTRGGVGDFLSWRGSELAIVLLVRRGPDPRPLGPGLPEEAFAHSRGLITKAEVRSAALALLALPREGVLWDVGAGSGSVAVEACLLAPGLRAFAVERTAEGLSHVAENRRRFRVAALTPVPGAAPEALAGLPDPDAVFIGGSGGRLREILEEAWQRLAGGGRLVVAAVLLETLAEALSWGRGRALEPELREIRSARGRAVGAGHALDPLNPVTLVAFSKPESR